MPTFETLVVNLEQKVAHISLNRPKKANAVNETLWFELRDSFIWADETPEVRAVVLSGEGRHFCAGIDFTMIQGLLQRVAVLSEGRKQEVMKQAIHRFQDAFSALARCRKPVLVAIQGSCIGAGVDLISACDIRYASKEAVFSIKEVDLGIVADVGSLQRLPNIVPDGILRELAFTGRSFDVNEAIQIGLLNGSFSDREEMMKSVTETAHMIASKSPLTIRGIKDVINYSRDHNPDASLTYTALMNSSLLLSEDTAEAVTSLMEKRPPVFED